jgi:AraC-like DNA-binding protein
MTPPLPVAAEPFGRHRVASTPDPDEAEGVLGAAFVPLRLRPIEYDSLDPAVDLAFNGLRFGDIVAGYIKFRQGVHIQVTELVEYHVNVPVRGRTVSRCGSMETVVSDPHRAAVFVPGEPADIQWEAGTEQLCVMLPRHLMHNEMELLLGRSIEQPVRFDPALDLTSELGRSWLDALWLIERHTSRPDGLADHPVAVANLGRHLVDALLLSQPHNYTGELDLPTVPAAPPIVRRAMDLLRDQPELPWSLGTLAREVAASGRALQDGFHRSIGVSPMRFLRDIRLERVHQDLLAGDPTATTVTSVAGRWGFGHLGRFAAEYRRRYGCAPIDTLRDRSRRVTPIIPTGTWTLPAVR